MLIHPIPIRINLPLVDTMASRCQFGMYAGIVLDNIKATVELVLQFLGSTLDTYTSEILICLASPLLYRNPISATGLKPLGVVIWNIPWSLVLPSTTPDLLSLAESLCRHILLVC